MFEFFLRRLSFFGVSHWEGRFSIFNGKKVARTGSQRYPTFQNIDLTLCGA
jgi:hypothetical protein